MLLKLGVTPYMTMVLIPPYLVTFLPGLTSQVKLVSGIGVAQEQVSAQLSMLIWMIVPSS